MDTSKKTDSSLRKARRPPPASRRPGRLLQRNRSGGGVVQRDETEPPEGLDAALRVKILRLMIKARCLEERTIMMSKSADGFFWIGGPGEEAFNVCLGLLAKPGSTLDHDFFHFHYRNSATMIAMGMDPKDAIRQMATRATDPFSGGRNFCSHYAYRPWNVMPVTSTIQTQFAVAPGTARAQKRHGGDGVTIATSGDAGTAEGDFHVGLNWATQPGFRLPLIFVVTNNRYGISTPYDQVRGAQHVAPMAEGYGMRWGLVDGTDVEASYDKLREVFEFVRHEREPYLLEASVSRLHGHSSSSGGNRVAAGSEADPITRWSERLVEQALIEEGQTEAWIAEERQRMGALLHEVQAEPQPTAESIHRHTFTAGGGER